MTLIAQKETLKAAARFELTISCLLDRRFNQLSHGAMVLPLLEMSVWLNHLGQMLTKKWNSNLLYINYDAANSI